jgi:hypothetical protein
MRQDTTPEPEPDERDQELEAEEDMIEEASPPGFWLLGLLDELTFGPGGLPDEDEVPE